MWLAKDKDGVFIFENKPEINIISIFVVSSGFYFEIPEIVVFKILGRYLYINDDPIEIEINKI